MFGDGKTTPEAFGIYLAEQVVAKLGPQVKQFLREAPTKLYDILRQTPNGPVQQQVSLPQMLAELTEAVRVQSYFSSEQLKIDAELLKETKCLRDEMKRSRKLAREMALEDEE